jgi:predicted alpha/beta hydrolase family esterase
MQPAKRVILISRWGGTSADDWYPWLLSELEPSGLFTSVGFASMPDPETPTIAGWTAALSGAVGASPDDIRNTVVVGHSVGCQAVLHYLQSLPVGMHVASTVLVAGWWTVDEPWESIAPWLRYEHDDGRIIAAAGAIHVLLSDNDPFTADSLTNAALWRTRLHARVHLVPGPGYFNRAQEPAVCSVLRAVAMETDSREDEPHWQAR